MRSALKKKKEYKYLLFKLIFGLILIVAVILFFVLSSKYWDGVSKFSFISSNENGDVSVTVLDPKFGEKVVIIIPGETEVEVSRGYGVMKIKNVWQLGINEKVGGRLLTETVTKNLHFPVFLYWNKKENNIGFVDRVRANIFTKKLDSFNKSEINLATSQFLKKTILTDGSTGYRLSGGISPRLTIYFSENKLADQNIKIKIVDSTDRIGVSEKVGKIIEVLGGKIVSIEKNFADESLDCTVSGKNNVMVSKMIDLFDCKRIGHGTNFDLEIHIGGKFASRL